MASTEIEEENVVSPAVRFSPGVTATVCGLISAVGYMAANICLRLVIHIDPIWVSCVKAIPTLLAVTPFLIATKRAGNWFPNNRTFHVILVTGLIGQLGGNVSFQWALGQIGLAIVVPLTLGPLIATSAIFGRVFLGDVVSSRMIVSGFILMVAICILSSEAQPLDTANARHVVVTAADQDSPLAANSVGTAWGVLAACFCGLAYCCLSIGIRYATNNGTPRKSVLGLVSLSGVISLGLVNFILHGMEPVTSSSFNDYVVMLMAGIFNYIAFVALIIALQEASVYFVNSLNASQTAMAALAGVFLFAEPFTTTAAIGIGLTIFGLIFMRKGKT